MDNGKQVDEKQGGGGGGGGSREQSEDVGVWGPWPMLHR